MIQFNYPAPAPRCGLVQRMYSGEAAIENRAGRQLGIGKKSVASQRRAF
jgi:hypothetical protein